MISFLPIAQMIFQVLRLTITVILFSFLTFTARAQNNSEATREITVSKDKTSRRHKVKIYPDANRKGIFFNVSGVKGKVYQFFLFDLNGKLVRQTNIRSRQTAMMNKIEKGTYLFEVFSDDERIETGKVDVK
ncbi:MAG: T9SS type A sorting domain-containing protein [Flavitalea sp.]